MLSATQPVCICARGTIYIMFVVQVFKLKSCYLIYWNLCKSKMIHKSEPLTATYSSVNYSRGFIYEANTPKLESSCAIESLFNWRVSSDLIWDSRIESHLLRSPPSPAGNNGSITAMTAASLSPFTGHHRVRLVASMCGGFDVFCCVCAQCWRATLRCSSSQICGQFVSHGRLTSHLPPLLYTI